MDGAVLAFGWEPGHGECEVRGAVWPLPAMQAGTIPPSQLSLHFRLQIFIKAVYLSIMLNRTINTVCSLLVHSPLVVLTSLLTFISALKPK